MAKIHFFFPKKIAQYYYSPYLCLSKWLFVVEIAYHSPTYNVHLHTLLFYNP